MAEGQCQNPQNLVAVLLDSGGNFGAIQARFFKALVQSGVLLSSGWNELHTGPQKQFPNQQPEYHQAQHHEPRHYKSSPIQSAIIASLGASG